MKERRAEEGIVMVVDDAKVLRRELSNSIRELGLPVRVAESGRRALHIAKERKVSVAVIDLRMPRMDGIDTGRALQEHEKSARIVFLSAFDSPSYRTRAKEVGLRVDSWITKNTDGITNTVEAVLRAYRDSASASSSKLRKHAEGES